MPAETLQDTSAHVRGETSRRLIIWSVGCPRLLHGSFFDRQEYLSRAHLQAQPDSGDAAYAGLDQVFRATITRIGKKKLKDKMGRDIVKEGEDMGHYVYGKVLGSGYFGNVRCRRKLRVSFRVNSDTHAGAESYSPVDGARGCH